MMLRKKRIMTISVKSLLATSVRSYTTKSLTLLRENLWKSSTKEMSLILKMIKMMKLTVKEVMTSMMSRTKIIWINMVLTIPMLR
jgi:uncharacterized HAD superfamily protein